MKKLPGRTRTAAVSAGRGRTVSRLLSTIAIVGMLATAGIIATPAPAAWAADYPSWDDVIAARNNETAKAAEVARVQSLLAGLEAAVASTQADAEAKGQIYFDAQQKFDAAARKAEELKKQADAAQATAAKSKADCPRCCSPTDGSWTWSDQPSSAWWMAPPSSSSTGFRVGGTHG